MEKYTKKENCRACNSQNISSILDLGEQPLANSYHEGKEKQDVFPLDLWLCKECFHLQLSVVVNPALMFEDYLYVSGTSRTMHEHFEYFANLFSEKINPSKRRSVLDIACNDGSQLDKFKNLGWETYGVDPAKNLYDLARSKHDVVCDYWSSKVAQKIGKKFDLLVAQNVFAHVDDIDGFLKGCYEAMHDDSYLSIQTSQANMIENNEFDTIYHEHLSFFNTKSMKVAANRNGFSLVDVFKAPIHGTSYIFVLKKGQKDEMISLSEIESENRRGLFSIETYEKYATRCKEVAKNFKDLINDLSGQTMTIVGYGAAAKGNTFLNFANVFLDYIIDDNPLKQNLLTPGMNIPIKSVQSLSEVDPEKLVIVPLAWNFFDEIKSRASKNLKKPGAKFLKYFPKIEISV